MPHFYKRFIKWESENEIKSLLASAPGSDFIRALLIAAFNNNFIGTGIDISVTLYLYFHCLCL